MFEELGPAFAAVMQPMNLAAMIAGVLCGIFVGALPGLTATMAIAVLIPLTFTLDPLVALGMMAGIYNGAIYGGAIPCILVRIPGTPAAIATVFDGYPMARQGRAREALLVAVVSSSIGGMASAVALILLAPPLASVTLAFGPPEIFWVAVFGLASISLVVGGDAMKGLLSVSFGLLVGMVGIDHVSGNARFTFDTLVLADGFQMIALLVGLFAIPPALQMAENAALSPDRTALKPMDMRKALGGLKRLWPVWTRSSLIGILAGILPGAGGNIAALLSYNETKRASKEPESFGKGNPAGVAASECANNADVASAMIPALTLGVPGSSVAAVILGGLLVHGLQPGPQLFRDAPDLVYGFMIQMFLSALILLPLGAFLATRVFAHAMRIPRAILAPLIIALSIVGVYTINNSMFDVAVVIGFGFLGYLIERLGIPLAPAVLGMILGGLAENNLRLSLIIGLGDPAILWTRPISQIFIALIVLVVLFPLVRRFRVPKHT